MIIDLPNGSSLIINEDATDKERIVFIMKGLSFGADILPPNEFLYGCDAWADREIELYEQALDMDLKAHRDFIRKCLRKEQ
jgi:hypothetical protein